MVVFNVLFILFWFSSSVFGSIDLRTNTILPPLVKDDVCSSIINEYPCVKNVLIVLTNHINENIQEIEALKQQNREYKHLSEMASNNGQEINSIKLEIKRLIFREKLKTQSMPNVDIETKEKIVSALQNQAFGSLDFSNELRIDKTSNQKGFKKDTKNNLEPNQDNWYRNKTKANKAITKWYDTTIWENIGELLHDQHLQIFGQDSEVDEDYESGRALTYDTFPYNYYNHYSSHDLSYSENTNVTNENEKDVWKKGYDDRQRGNWKRMGEEIDRQLGGLAGLFSTVALPIASVGGLALGGVNSINAMNQQNTLDDNQKQIESLKNDLTSLQARTSSLESKKRQLEASCCADISALTSRVTALESSTSGLSTLSSDVSTVQTKTKTLETKMANIGNSLKNLCTTLESVNVKSTTDKFQCCANDEWGKIWCTQPGSASLIGISDLGSGTCDELKSTGGVCENG